MTDLINLENVPDKRLEEIKQECYVDHNQIDMMTYVLKRERVLDTKLYARRLEEEFGITFRSINKEA